MACDACSYPYVLDQTRNNASDPWLAPPCRLDHPTPLQDETGSVWIGYPQFTNMRESCFYGQQKQ